MTPSLRRPGTLLVSSALVLATGAFAQSSRDLDPLSAPPGASTRAAPAAATATSRSGAPSRSALGKGPLPDPVLLDGSAQPAEKKPEHGMLGEFELPGDDNATGGKVGGQQMPPGQQQQPQQQGMSVSIP